MNHGESSLQRDLELSIVIPAYNEELVIGKSLLKIDSVLSKIGVTSEIIVIDDGSTDLTVQTCVSTKLGHSKLRIIKLARNYGHMEAITVGMKEAIGEWVATIDADLQDPPDLLIEMYKIARQGEHQVIQAVRNSRPSDSVLKRNTAAIFYKWMDFLTNGSTISQGADFRMLNKVVAKELSGLPEREKVYRLLIPSLGYRIKTVYFERQPRAAGNTKYNFRKMSQLAVLSTLSFSTKPLQFVTRFGLYLSATMLCGSFLVAFVKLFIPTVSGWASIVLLLLASNAFIIFSIGIVGEYIGLIYKQIQNRPTSQYQELET
jgi:glycosyltransferase involved in cell wall biosynthesis